MSNELLMEAKEALTRAHDHLIWLTSKLPMQYFGLVDPDIVQECAYMIDRIDARLAEPQDGAMELVGKIRDARLVSTRDKSYRRFVLTDSEAAALIEARDRTVPRAMLEEVYCEGYAVGYIQPMRSTKSQDIDRIAAKYRVKVEATK